MTGGGWVDGVYIPPLTVSRLFNESGPLTLLTSAGMTFDLDYDFPVNAACFSMANDSLDTQDSGVTIHVNAYPSCDHGETYDYGVSAYAATLTAAQSIVSGSVSNMGGWTGFEVIMSVSSAATPGPSPIITPVILHGTAQN